jgi:hypothetical protein
MTTLKAASIGLVLITSFGLVPSERATEATKASNPRIVTAENTFLGRWSSHTIYTSGEVSDGALDISDVVPASANRVSVVHSFRGGPFTGYILSDPDRIEVQMPLGDGRVAHYNGVLVAADRIEGHFFVTGDGQSNHGHKRSASSRVSGSVQEENGTWVATQP